MRSWILLMLLDRLKEIVGPAGWESDPDTLQPQLTEWRGVYHGTTPLLVAPCSTAEVAAVVRACASARTAIVAQGGNTGLCGGAIPDNSGTQILLSLSRMNKVRSIEANDFSMVAEAGCVLADIQSRARAAGRLFPLSLAAEGSSQIGGNISTNAGGTNVLKYGTARAQVLGLEVVLADGTVWDGIRSLRKDTAGYDIKQLFIGAEGTLGIITAASLRLFPLPPESQTALVAVASADEAVSLLAELRIALADQIEAFELMPARALRFVTRHISGTRAPFEREHPWYVLIDCSSAEKTQRFLSVLMGSIEAGRVIDAVVASNAREAAEFWRLRHAISEAQKHEGASLKHDISVPVGQIGRFIRAAESAVHQIMPEARVVAFGHVGDGNVHFNISQPKGVSAAEFTSAAAALSDAVHSVTRSFNGSISAEHGIGQAKRELLQRHRSPTELALMRTVKRALDPENIMNPGKVL
jgi:FAD/FMN-containing dehydrogenase